MGIHTSIQNKENHNEVILIIGANYEWTEKNDLAQFINKPGLIETVKEMQLILINDPTFLWGGVSGLTIS